MMMKTRLMNGPHALALAALLAAAQAGAQVTFYEHEGFRGQSFTTDRTIVDLERWGFNDRASSVDVLGQRWEVCDDARFNGRCVVLRPGRYPSLAAMGLNDRVSSLRRVSPYAGIDEPRYAPAPVAPQVIFYEHEGFAGRTFGTQRQVGNFGRFGFADRASSAIVLGGPWEVCDDAWFGGRCIVLNPGRYPSLDEFGLNDHVRSARIADAAVEEGRAGPAPMPYASTGSYHSRPGERLYEANVTAVHAVIETPERRCWVEREAVNEANIPGAVIGAVIGGILGHQIGGGRGNDLATAGGAVAGAAVGANVGTAPAQHCRTVPSQARPTYWDVTYVFRGLEHHVQVTNPPGTTVVVNEQGEPRV